MKQFKQFNYQVSNYKDEKLLRSVDAYDGEAISAHTKACKEFWGGNRIVVLNLSTATVKELGVAYKEGTLSSLFIN